MTKNKIVRKFWPKSTFFEIFGNIGIVRKFSTKSKISKIWLSRNFSNFLEKIEKFLETLSKSKYFRKFDYNRNLSEFSKKSEFPKKYRKFSKISTKIEIFWIFSIKSKFFENFTKIEIFRNFRKNRYFSEILT